MTERTKPEEERRTANDERRTTNGERRMTNGERRTTNGERRTTKRNDRTTKEEERPNDEVARSERSRSGVSVLDTYVSKSFPKPGTRFLPFPTRFPFRYGKRGHFGVSMHHRLEEYINKMSVEGSWSQNAIQATNAWLREGLKQRCITRDLKWGVPVPHDNFRDKVFYVWFDAPIGYVSITKCYTPDWEKWWKNPEDVELYQFMGKDNVPFHTVMFPSTLLGTGENWTLMKTIRVTEYLNYEAGKFSKSKGIGVFGNDAKDTNIPVEVWRYYLLTNRPEVSDTLFTWVDLQAKLNSELLNNLGNFINRVLSFVAKPSGQGYDSIIPDAQDAISDPLTEKIAEKVGKYVEQYVEAMEKVKLKQGLKLAMSISSEGNAYLQESRFWKLYKEDQPRCSIVMRTAVGLVHLLACLLEPFMPSFSVKVFKQLNLPPETHISLCDDKGDTDRARRPWEIVPRGHKIGKPEPLFKELINDEVDSLRKKFAGSQADRKEREEAEAVKLAEQLKKSKVSG